MTFTFNEEVDRQEKFPGRSRPAISPLLAKSDLERRRVLQILGQAQ